MYKSISVTLIFLWTCSARASMDEDGRIIRTRKPGFSICFPVCSEKSDSPNKRPCSRSAHCTTQTMHTDAPDNIPQLYGQLLAQKECLIKKIDDKQKKLNAYEKELDALKAACGTGVCNE